MENLEIEDTGNCKKKIKVTIPSQLVTSKMNQIINDLQFKVDIPGFRKGKVANDIIMNRYKDVINKEIINNLIPLSIETIAKENNIKLIFPINVESAEIGLDNSLKYVANVEYIPKFELQEYKGIKLNKNKIKVTTAEIDEFIKHLQNRVAELVIVEGRKPKDDDHVFLNIEEFTKDNPTPIRKEENLEFVLGHKQLLPEIEELAKNLNKNEEKEIDITPPKDAESFENTSASDSDVENNIKHFKVKLQEVKEVKLPPLDDEFARDMGEFKTLEELKTQIEKEIYKNKQEEINRDLKKQLRETIISINNFNIPERLIEEEKERIKKEIEELFKNSNKEILNEEKNNLESKIEENAVKNVKASIIFDEIAKKEKNNITVETEEINREIEIWKSNLPSGYKKEDIAANDSVRTYFYSQIITEKIYNFLLNCAIIDEVE